MRFTILTLLIATTAVALLFFLDMQGFALFAFLVFFLPLLATLVFVRVFTSLQYRFANAIVPCLYTRSLTWLLTLTCGRQCSAWALNNYGAQLLESGKWDAALDAFDSVLKLDDSKKEYWLWRGVANFEQRKWAEVIQDASEAIAFDPKFEDAYAYRGFSRFFLDDIAGALEDFDKVQCTQKSQSSLAWYRGHANESFGQWRKAIGDYLLAYELDPSNVAAGIGLARLQASCPDASLRDGVKSIENAMSMCIRTDWKDWTAISVLAAAYAEAGDFASAIKQAQAAQELAPEEDKSERAARVEQYQHEIPFRLVASLQARE